MEFAGAIPSAVDQATRSPEQLVHAFCLRMIFSENRYPLFRIML